MGDYTRQINYKGKDHIAATYYAKKKGEVVTSTLWNAVLGALVTRSNAYDIALQQTAAFESNFLLFQQEYRKFTQDFEVFKSNRAQFESNTIERFNSLESAIGGLQVRQSKLETDTTSRFIDLESFVSELETAVDQRMTRSEVHDYVTDELSKIKLVEVVTELPEKGETNKLYLLPVPIEDNDGQDDIFFEYVWADNTWERLGTKQIKVNLDEYVKNTDYATSNKAGVMKIGTGLVQMGDGVVQLYPALEREIDGKAVIKAITPQFLDYAVKVGVTTNTEALTEEEKAAACEWLGVNALAIQNIVSGGEKILIVNDVAPFPHKCSLRLTSDTYVLTKGESKNLFDSTGRISVYNSNAVEENYSINEDGSINFYVKFTDDESDTYFDLTRGIDLTLDVAQIIPGEKYTCTLSNKDGHNWQVFIQAFNADYEEAYDDITYFGDYTFSINENVKYITAHFYAYAELGEIIDTVFYPQLELGATATEWAAYGGVITEEKSYIENFGEVTVYVNGVPYGAVANGTVTDIASASPTMEITTDNEHANICDFTYCADTKKYVDAGTQYEVITEITVEEATKHMVIPLGKERKSVKLYIKTPIITTAGSGSIAANGTNVAVLGSAFFSTSQAREILVEIDVIDGFGTLGKGSYSTNNLALGTPIEAFNDGVYTPFNELALTRGSSFEAGTTIKVWGNK